jgi:hypothetical protein
VGRSARDPIQFALIESYVRVVALLFAGASFGGPASMGLSEETADPSRLWGAGGADVEDAVPRLTFFSI